MSSIFSSNSEAFTSKLLEDIEDMFLLYYTHSDWFDTYKSSTTHESVIRRERVKRLKKTSLYTD